MKVVLARVSMDVVRKTQPRKPWVSGRFVSPVPDGSPSHWMELNQTSNSLVYHVIGFGFSFVFMIRSSMTWTSNRACVYSFARGRNCHSRNLRGQCYRLPPNKNLYGGWALLYRKIVIFKWFAFAVIYTLNTVTDNKVGTRSF